MNNNLKSGIAGLSRVLSMGEKEEWQSLLARAYTYDFSHTWSFHYLHQNAGLPLLFLYNEDDDFVAIPFIKRKVPNFDCYDLTSVYGYCGPFSNLPFSKLNEGFAQRFKVALNVFLRREQIVTVFSGLNPFMDQLSLSSVFEGLKDNGKTVAIDLSLDIDTQRRNYKKGISGKIQAQRARGWTFRSGETKEDIESFLEIYRATMNRVEAADRYRFEAPYIAALLSSADFDARLVFLDNELGEAICAAIIIAAGSVLQAYLLSTRQSYRYLSPAKLLTEEITLLGRDLGLGIFNLGGGLGFKEDTLYEWKRGFSPLSYEYKTWRYIVDVPMYEEIMTASGIDPQSTTDFFPLYRIETITN